jgi:hypothetical protein
MLKEIRSLEKTIREITKSFWSGLQMSQRAAVT